MYGSNPSPVTAKSLSLVMDDRRAWERVTAGSRRLAAVAGAELRRRHRGQQFTPLWSAELEVVTDTERAGLRPGCRRAGPQDQRVYQGRGGGRSLFAGPLASREPHGA